MVSAPQHYTLLATTQATNHLDGVSPITMTQIMSQLAYNYVNIDGPPNEYGNIVAYPVTGINNNGQVVGWNFVYSNGTYTTVRAATLTFASDINDQGEVVGYTNGLGPSFEWAFLYSGDTYTYFNADRTDFGIRFTGINDLDQIVGFTGRGDTFLYSGGTYTFLEEVSWAARVYADDINDAGQIVGYYLDSVSAAHGFIYNNGTYTTVDNPLATGETYLTAISDTGQIVGYYYDASGKHGFLFNNGNFTTIDNPLGVGDTELTGINDYGQIVGNYIDDAGVYHGFLADPIINDTAPVITTAAEHNISENTTIVAALTSNDADTVGINPATFTISGGTDAALFDLVEGNLVFKSAKDFETDPHSYQVEVSAFDGVNTTAKTITVNLTDVNETPTAVALANAMASIIENTSTASHIKVADITVTDDALGTNTLTLSGMDAAFFEIVGTELFLRAGTILDFESKSSYAVAVTVDDIATAVTPDLLSSTFTLNITNVSGVEISGTSRNDTINAATTVVGQPLPTNEGDVIRGGAGSDNIAALAGNDIIDGGTGADIMRGGLGNDTYVVDSNGDLVIESYNEGVDTVQSGLSYVLTANVENLTLTGSKSISGTGNELSNVDRRQYWRKYTFRSPRCRYTGWRCWRRPSYWRWRGRPTHWRDREGQICFRQFDRQQSSRARHDHRF